MLKSKFREVCTSQVLRSRTLHDDEKIFDKQSEAYRFSGTCYFVCCTFTVLRFSYICIKACWHHSHQLCELTTWKAIGCFLRMIFKNLYQVHFVDRINFFRDSGLTERIAWPHSLRMYGIRILYLGNSKSRHLCTEAEGWLGRLLRPHSLRLCKIRILYLGNVGSRHHYMRSQSSDVSRIIKPYAFAGWGRDRG